MDIYIYIYIYLLYIFIYYIYILHIYKLFMSPTKMSIYISKNKTFNYARVIFRFLPNFRRLNKITAGVESKNLKTN